MGNPYYSPEHSETPKKSVMGKIFSRIDAVLSKKKKDE